MFKELWSRNVKELLKQNGLSTAEAARLVGTSKQYLSTILSDAEPTSTKEAVMERLCFLLHTTPSQLFSPQNQERCCEVTAVIVDEAEADLPPVEIAILAERHFLAGEFSKAYCLCCSLLAQHKRDLAPGAKAQTLLLAGKSGCLAGKHEESLPLLKEALYLFQKRLVSQPDKYIPLCMDCYRYLGLARYSAGNYRDAARWLARVCTLATRYPNIAADLENKIEEAVSNWLRSTVKQGSLGEFLQAAKIARFTADVCSFTELKRRVRIEELFCFYPLAVVSDEVDVLLREYADELQWLREQNLSMDTLQLVHYILLLHAAEQHDELVALQQGFLQQGSDGALVRAVLDSFGRIQQARELVNIQSTVSATTSVALQALIRALQGLYCESMGLFAEAHSMWQTSLGMLNLHHEIPLYIYFLHWYLKTTALQLPLEEKTLTAGLLNKALADFAPKTGETSPWK